MELIDKTLYLRVALVDLFAVHEAGAQVVVQVVAADGVVGRLAFTNLNLLSAGEAAEAVAVGNDHRAAALDKLGEFGVVNFRAGENDLRPERELRLRLAGL